MKDRDIEALVKALAPVVRDFVGKELGPLLKRLADLEEAGKASRESIEAIRTEALEAVDKAVPEAVSAAVAALPVPKDGQDGAPGRDGRDGVDGKDGVDGEKGLDGAQGPAGEPGNDGAAGKDGIGLADALIDRDGNLVLTMTDGATKSLGVIVGKDGAPGRDGADGLGFDDLEIVEGGTDFTLRFTRGDLVKEWTLAKPTLADSYRGVWKEGDHTRGCTVTWGGSLWLAKNDTTAKPETNDDWVLITKRGRDGKDGEAPKGPAKVKL